MKTQMLTVAAFLCTTLSMSAASAPSGASIFFQTDDPAAYIQLLKSDTKLFKASGALQRGVCFNSTGMTEAGRNAYAAAAELDRKIVMDQIVRCMNTNSAM